ncbi:hypothetical protein A5633_04125 [Mycolicibacterium elephantis]|uniref:ATP-binding protein n=1 Tax=Mycolicibacterium elephantis TaxID=81858 RepID=UPI0007EAFC6D|nr:ATP-binding protein [Mycolicibacterium elephantis]OBA65319.1 hypothetical protein A5633_04125 [Mycolicibacterium elephantis]
MSQSWDIAEPRPEALIESLRAFGYSPEAAVADLVDNSVSAGAREIAVDFVWNGEDSLVRVTDDGWGMSGEELVAAMRPGSTSPLDRRDAADLGRFGLGMKTASFSQAREFTVISRRRGSRVSCTRRWDLDTVVETGEWRLLRNAPVSLDDATLPTAGGTIVQWSKLDRLVGSVKPNNKKAHKRFLDITRRVHKHLEATFHRFLGGKDRIHITVNGVDVEPWDPFMTRHPATQILAAEELPFRGHLITVQPYVLPHRSKLDELEASRGAGITGWNQQQGFYVYRSRRLLVQGDWLNLGLAKDEHTKLARIAIEFPASLDHEWQVDVKKSTARPPGELIENLQRIARATRSKAEEVYRHRGKIIAHKNSKPFVFAWQQYKDRDGQLRYKVNRKHPVIASLLEAAGPNKNVLERALRFVEETVPTTLIGVSLADSLDIQPAPFGRARIEIGPLAEFAYHGLIKDGANPEDALARISAAEPFSQYPEAIAALKESTL